MGRLKNGVRIAAVALATLMTVMACGNSSGGGGGSSNKTLVVDKSFDLKTIDPQREFEFTGGPIVHAMYDTLLTFKGVDVTRPIPSVASSYTASADARTYTFKLRSDVKLSDATPLTSASAAFPIDRTNNLLAN